MSSAEEVARGVRAVAEHSPALLLFGPSSAAYVPVVGDVWAATVWRTPGLPVGRPDGWVQVTERERVPWPSGRSGLATAAAWFRVASGNEPTPFRVTFPLGVAGSAEGFVVTYRVGAFTCPRCGRSSRNPQDAANGYCGACCDWTGPAAPRPDQLARWPLEEMFEEASR